MFKNLSNEVWRDIEDYPGYQVSNLGRVRSLDYRHTGQTAVLKLGENGDGYLRVDLCKNGKRKSCKVHRLIAIAFIPNPLNLPEVNHINEDKTDNRVENLSWVSHIQNINHGTRNQRQAETQKNRSDCSKRVAQYTLDGTLIAVYPSACEAARQTDFKQASISTCCLGKRKKTGGYIWKYIY